MPPPHTTENMITTMRTFSVSVAGSKDRASLSVPHMQLIKRQLRVLVAQKLDDKPLTLVLNAVSKEQLETLPLKTAETAVGRPFDLVIPMDERTANLAVNQGLELNAVKRGAKITTAVDQLASLATTGVLAPAQNTGFNIKFW